MSKPGGDPSSGISSEDVLIPTERHPACRRREARSGSCMERENLCAVVLSVSMESAKGEAASGCNREGESTDAERRGGAARSSDEGSVMGLERRGCVVQPGHGPTGRREEPVDEAKPFSIPKAGGLGSLQACEGQPGSGWSGRTVDCGVRGQPFEQPLQALESAVVRELLSSAGAAGRYSESEWRDAAVGHSDGCRPHRPGGRPALLWSRSWSRCSIPTPTATDPANLRSMPWRKARERCWRYDWVLDLDIKGFFDSIDWELMLKAVRHHTDCPWVLLYIERWLKAPVQMEDGSDRRAHGGDAAGRGDLAAAGEPVPALRRSTCGWRGSSRTSRSSAMRTMRSVTAEARRRRVSCRTRLPSASRTAS